MSRNKEKYVPRAQADIRSPELFTTGEEAWFWFITAQRARAEGARFTAGQAVVPRPCEPIDILKILDRLYRTRRLLMDHVQVLRHYGVRQCPPDRRRPKEVRAYHLWCEAMDCMEAVMVRKGIVSERPRRQSNWFENVKFYEDA
jgi:hypothetical protein